MIRFAVALLVGITLTGCASPSQEKQTLTILAASSLAESFTDLGNQFAKQHPGTEVKFSFGSSATLAEQVVQGAPASLLATADERTMLSAKSSLATEAAPFASNSLVLVTAPGITNITTLADLAKTDFVTCVETAPCGSLANNWLASEEVTAEPVNREIDAKSTIARVTSGEASAALVFATDALTERDLVTVVPVAPPGPATTYYLAVTEQAAEPGLAQDFLDYVVSQNGQERLAEYGFAAA
jgi:molybdate transport system substrate-binding protein